ncbi:MAG: PQQ-binding-like beta-propeller repeat protein [Planctomycetota bacterium]
MKLQLWITCVLLACPCRGEDWTEFRGPDGQGHSSAKTLPLSWNETNNVAWKVPIEGDGWSSPVVADGRIYVTTAVRTQGGGPKSRSLRTLCLDADSGQSLWNVEVFRQGGDGVQIHKKNSHASATPILRDDRVFVHFGPAGTACLSTDGDVIWKNKELAFAPIHGNGGSPALRDDTLVFTCDGRDKQFVAALSATTGEVTWTTDRRADVKKGFSFCTPLFINVNGKAQVVCPGSGAVVAYEPETGKEIWSCNYGEGYSVVPRPVYANGLVFVSSCYDSASLYAIDPTGTGDVTDTHVRWTIRRGVPKTPSMLVIGNELYFVDDGGVASCVDSRTGDPHWKQRLGGKYSASLFYGAERIYIQSENGKTTVIAPGTEFKELATNELSGDERTFASFATVENAILLRSESHLYRIE